MRTAYTNHVNKSELKDQHKPIKTARLKHVSKILSALPSLDVYTFASATIDVLLIISKALRQSAETKGGATDFNLVSKGLQPHVMTHSKHTAPKGGCKCQMQEGGAER